MIIRFIDGLIRFNDGDILPTEGLVEGTRALNQDTGEKLMWSEDSLSWTIGWSHYDDAWIHSHVDNTSNPHNVTPAQIGALPLTGGTLTGPLYLTGSREGQLTILSTDDITGWPKAKFSNNSQTKWVDFEYDVGSHLWGLYIRDSVEGIQNSFKLYTDHISSGSNIRVGAGVPDTDDSLARKDYVDNSLSSHTSRTDNPHDVTAAQVGADPTGSADAVQANLDTHISDVANPHSVTAAQVGADPTGSAAAVQANLDTHVADVANPHVVTKSQVGLGFVIDTGDGSQYLTDDGTYKSASASVVWGDITGTLSNQTDLQNALDAKFNLTGGTVTGKTTIQYESPKLSINGTSDATNPGVQFKAITRNYWTDFEYNSSDTLHQFTIFLRHDDGTRATVTDNYMRLTTSDLLVNGNTVWNRGNDGSGSGLDADLLRGYAPTSVSSGSADANKPVLLNGDGRIDVSMLDTSTFYYVGTHDPSAGVEYPDTTGESAGAFWVVDVLIAPNDGSSYIFQAGDLAGKVITVGDFMVWGTGGWGIMAGEMNPTLYYKLDGTYALTADFAGGGFRLTSIADGIDDTDGATIAQVKLKADLTYVDSVNSSQDAAIVNAQATADSAQSDIDTHIADTSNPHGVTTSQIGAEASLGNPASDGQVLSSTASGTRSWISLPTYDVPESIDDLSDVDTSTTPPTEGQVLGWDDTNSQWIPINQEGGSSLPPGFTGGSLLTWDGVNWVSSEEITISEAGNKLYLSSGKDVSIAEGSGIMYLDYTNTLQLRRNDVAGWYFQGTSFIPSVDESTYIGNTDRWTKAIYTYNLYLKQFTDTVSLPIDAFSIVTDIEGPYVRGGDDTNRSFAFYDKSITPNDGQILSWDSITGLWVPSDPSGGGDLPPGTEGDLMVKGPTDWQSSGTVKYDYDGGKNSFSFNIGGKYYHVGAIDGHVILESDNGGQLRWSGTWLLPDNNGCNIGSQGDPWGKVYTNVVALNKTTVGNLMGVAQIYWDENKNMISVLADNAEYDNFDVVGVKDTYTLSDGDVLAWDATNGEWVPGSGGGGGTDELVKKDAADPQAGYLENKIIAGSYITFNDVNNPTYGNQISVNAFLNLEDLMNVDSGAFANDTIVYDGVDWVPTGFELRMLNDVDASSPNNGDALIWDEAQNMWINGAVGGGTDEKVAVASGYTPNYLGVLLSGGTGIGITSTAPPDGNIVIQVSNLSIKNLTDVDTNMGTPADNDVLSWDSSISKWTNSSSGFTDKYVDSIVSDGPIIVLNYNDSGNISTELNLEINDLNNVNAVPNNGQVLTWHSSSNNWIAGDVLAEVDKDSVDIKIVEMNIIGTKPTRIQLDDYFNPTKPFRTFIKDVSGTSRIFFIVYDGTDYYFEELNKI